MVTTRSGDASQSDIRDFAKRGASAEPDVDAKSSRPAKAAKVHGSTDMTGSKPSDEKASASPDSEPAPATKAKEGEGQELADGEEACLERGHVHFLVRPRIDHEDNIEGIDDLAKLDMVLVPSTKQPAYRIISIGQKRMAEVGVGDSKDGREGKPAWAAVFGVGDDLSDIATKIGPKTYMTKTKGERTQPGARPVASGSYSIHYSPGDGPSKTHTHLAYVLSEPTVLGEVQEGLGIHSQASYIVQVKDPRQGGPARGSLKPERRADYPDELLQRFTNKFRPVKPIRLLDYNGAELLLIAEREAIATEVGDEEAKDDEKEARKLKRHAVFDELHLHTRDFPAVALDGDWQ